MSWKLQKGLSSETSTKTGEIITILTFGTLLILAISTLISQYFLRTPRTTNTKATFSQLPPCTYCDANEQCQLNTALYGNGKDTKQCSDTGCYTKDDGTVIGCGNNQSSTPTPTQSVVDSGISIPKSTSCTQCDGPPGKNGKSTCKYHPELDAKRHPDIQTTVQCTDDGCTTDGSNGIQCEGNKTTTIPTGSNPDACYSEDLGRWMINTELICDPNVTDAILYCHKGILDVSYCKNGCEGLNCKGSPAGICFSNELNKFLGVGTSTCSKDGKSLFTCNEGYSISTTNCSCQYDKCQGNNNQNSPLPILNLSCSSIKDKDCRLCFMPEGSAYTSLDIVPQQTIHWLDNSGCTGYCKTQGYNSVTDECRNQYTNAPLSCPRLPDCQDVQIGGSYDFKGPTCDNNCGSNQDLKCNDSVNKKVRCYQPPSNQPDKSTQVPPCQRCENDKCTNHQSLPGNECNKNNFSCLIYDHYDSCGWIDPNYSTSRSFACEIDPNNVYKIRSDKNICNAFGCNSSSCDINTCSNTSYTILKACILNNL